MKNYEGRQTDLRNRINKHLQKITGKNVDFFSKLNQSDIIELKRVLSDINNLLTFKMTIEAMNWICSCFGLNETERKKYLLKIDETKPNSKGFDIYIDSPHKILAEVKCISPVNNGDRFGVAQHDGIMKDVENLARGKGKISDTSQFFKFLFLIDLGDRTDKAISQLLPVTKGKTEIANNFNGLKRDFLVWLKSDEKFKELDISKVYLKKIKVN